MIKKRLTFNTHICYCFKLINPYCLHGVGDPGLVGLVSFVFTLIKKLTPLDRDPPLHVNSKGLSI